MKKFSAVMTKCLFILMISVFCLNFLSAQEYPGFKVEGRHLYDKTGEKVILRGINTMSVWNDKDGTKSFPGIEKTGANAVRIVWGTWENAQALDTIITNCITNHMIPVIECHDAKGDWSKLQTIIDYWSSPTVVSVIQKHQEYLIINIANEAGNETVTDVQFRTAYEAGILQMRAAGIHVPLIIDGTDWGKNIDVLQAEGPYLISVDPDHNLMFSVHMWWPEIWGYTAQTVIDEIAESVALDLPLIIGEFAHKWPESASPIPYLTIIEQCQLNEIGYFPWSWGPGNNHDPSWDMTSNGSYYSLQGWGEEVAVTSPYSIQNTSVRTEFINYYFGKPTPTPEPTPAPTPFDPGDLETYTGRFMEMWNELHDPANGYFSPEGAPYHSIETLICEAPDYGHETTSEAYSFYIWLEAAYGRITGDWDYLAQAWQTTENQIIPGSADQPGVGNYDPSAPAEYAAEWDLPDGYPSQLRFEDITEGSDPISAGLHAAYGNEIYGMHWLLDCDNWYGYGNRGDGVSKPSYINTFQRGPQESVWETIPHPSWEEFKWGGSNGFLDLFTGDNSYSRQWRYTNAPDADARIVQAMYWAKLFADSQGVNINQYVAKTVKMGDFLRLSFFDKYFKTIGANTTEATAGSGYDSCHYLLSWYYAWGAGIGASWSWRIGCSHAHFGYQNPVAAWTLSTQDEFRPKASGGAADWGKSLDRQIEFYQWLQSPEGAFAGGATNSWKGRYAPYPAGVSTFYGMAYDEKPVYHDPGSNTWFGWQAWSIQRLAEYYYLTADKEVETMLIKWAGWVKDNVNLIGSDDYEIPAKLSWSGQPDTWNGSPSANSGLQVTIEEHTNDVGITACLARALAYYAAGLDLWGAAPDVEAANLAKELMDRMWNTYRDDQGVSVPEARGDFNRFFDQEVYVPSGWSGRMGNGDQIQSGVSFIDIRSKYYDDPAFPVLKDAYDNGVDPVFRYHRTWAQIDVALANLDVGTLIMGENGGMPTPPPPPTPTPEPTPYQGVGDNLYVDRFLDMWNELHDPGNGYFSPEGAPYHSIETLICEAPDYGHETTSEAYSFYIWLEGMYGKVTGDWNYLKTAWAKTEDHIIPGSADQPAVSNYDPNKPAEYAAEWDLPNGYPSQLRFDDIQEGRDPISGGLKSAYGPEIYGMHWLLDCDNWYGYGNRGDGVSKPSYINTFQRGPQESVWETVPHPSWEEFKWGGSNGFLDLFTGDKSYSKQWRYTNAPDADARIIQAMFWSKQAADGQGADISAYVDKTAKMGDFLRLSFFDKYFKKIAADTNEQTTGNGYDSCHYLLSWYYAWGAGIGASWSWRIGCSHAHFGYQNPVAAWVMSTNSDFRPKASGGVTDWSESLDRQIEFYQWLQSPEGAFAGGATNSWKGRYAPYPTGVSTFYGMAYDEKPVYHDPGSNTWFGWQAWSIERLAEYYYLTGKAEIKTMLDKWTDWVKANVHLIGTDDYEIPAKLAWSGQPDTWTGSPSSNSGLSVTIEEYTNDVGIAACMARALIYYAAGTEKWDTIDEASKTLAKEVLDRMWNKYRDEQGVSVPETRGDFNRFFDQEIYIPSGWSGKMANGDSITQGVSFIDIRSKYYDDPDFPVLKAAYDNGEDPVFRYHRTWAQIDVALANLDYGTFFGDDISPTQTPEPGVKGDADGDGALSILDALLISRYSAGFPVELDSDAADVNGDGQVSILDALLVARASVGLITLE